ncbi:hypothetical protein [Variovorax sp. OV700]|uniref:hypothetical protein n=1 Tax=Variovorax sp. OV700 TaxID=1882826 RepID=UPI00087E4CCB|nr:hypothetical protein [Variovorax sp. OV700]SDH93406.1 hypothetical protein SAMN05444748_1032 [Variovorax sp. OV700]
MNDVERSFLTPKERLAISRRALVKELNGDDEPDDRLRSRRGAAGQEPAGIPDVDDTAEPGHPFRGHRRWVSMARSMTERWWRRHPAHAVGQLARPVLEHYARKEPAKLMAIAAATGAAMVLLKPWRLLSFTAVLAAVLKTSDVADVVNTLMQKNTSPRKDPS